MTGVMETLCKNSSRVKAGKNKSIQNEKSEVQKKSLMMKKMQGGGRKLSSVSIVQIFKDSHHL